MNEYNRQMKPIKSVLCFDVVEIIKQKNKAIFFLKCKSIKKS